MSIRVQSWFGIGLCCLPLGWLWYRLIDHLRIEWQVNPQYAYGWAVPFLCLYLLWRRVTRQAQTPRVEAQNTAGTTPSASHSASRFAVPALLVFILVAFLYAPTRLIQEANPEWRFISWALTLIVIGLTLLFLSLVKLQIHSTAPSPRTAPSPGQRPPSPPLGAGEREGRGGTPEFGGSMRGAFGEFSPPLGKRADEGQVGGIPLQRLTVSPSALVFPLLYFLVAVPWPTIVEGRLIQWLTSANVAVTIELLAVFGIPALQHGNIIEISSGVVGVDDACSGIRSFQASLMLSLFFGELYSLSGARRFFCVLLGFVLSFVFNAARTLLLTVVASFQGVKAVENWHDPAGVTVLVWCFVALWFAALVMKGAKESEASTSNIQPKAESAGSLADRDQEHSTLGIRRSTSDGESPPALQRLAFGLMVWLVMVEAGVEWWYRSHEKNMPAAVAWSVAFPADKDAFRELPFTDKARQFLRYDEGRNCAWREDDGARWQGIYLRWNPGKIAVHLAKSHTPEVCLSAAGRKMVAKSDVRLFEASGLRLPFFSYVFEGPHDRVHVFYCLWEDRAAEQGFDTESLTYGKRLAPVLAGRRNSGQRTLELAVWGIESQEAAAAALQKQLDKVIRVGHAARAPERASLRQPWSVVPRLCGPYLHVRRATKRALTFHGIHREDRHELGHSVTRQLKMRSTLAAVILALTALCANAALVLTGTSYTESFDSVGTTSPAYWTVRTGATLSGLGSLASYTASATSWADTDGEFRNVASAEGLTSSASTAAQDASTDRAWGIRQTGTFGDPGAAFVLQIQDTAGFDNFSLSIKLQMLDVETRSTTWTIDYRIGGAGDFTALATYSDPGTFGSTTHNFNAVDLAAWNNQSSEIWFRVIALSGSTGSGSRDTFAIDDFSLGFTPIPEPAEWGLICAAGLLGVCGLQTWRERRRAVRQSAAP